MTSMTNAKRTRLIQMAEGYLDLTMVFEDLWPLDKPHCEKMADRAIECLDQVKRPLSHKSYVAFLKGQAHRTAGRYFQAIEFFEQSLKLDPDNLHAYLAVAWCYKRTNEIDKAIDAMKLALKVEPSNALTHYNLACYWALEENIELAVLHLSFALDLNSDYRDKVADETDFDSIRDKQSFQSIVTVNA